MIYFFQGFKGFLIQWSEHQNGSPWLVAAAFLTVMIAGYLLGSVNTAIILSKNLYGADVRDYGSGNAGMTNMFRAFGKKAGFLTLAGDSLKALLAVVTGFLIMGDMGSYVGGFFCLLGHSFPVFFHFKGGKGVVVSAITILFINPVVFLLLILIFGLMFLATQIVSASSITAAFFYPALVYGIGKATGTFKGVEVIFALFIGMFVIAMHRENIHRMINHTEKKIEFGKNKKNKKDKK